MGNVVCRGRWFIVAAWALLAGALLWLVPPQDAASHEDPTYLPPASPTNQAIRAMDDAFPGNSGLSEAVIVFQRSEGPLTGPDRAAVEAVAGQIVLARDLPGVTVRSPASLPVPQNPLVSRDGRAALVKANIPFNFVSIRSARMVDSLRAILHRSDLPAGLSAAVTGSSGFGRDYAAAADRSHRRTVYITLISVIVVLLAVYRAPVAAMVPLSAISLAAVVVLKLLVVCGRFGLHAATAEHIFVIVLLYGAGIDYSLLLISRYRECLTPGKTPAQALAEAMDATLTAILAAGATTTSGLLMLCFASFTIFRTTGAAVGIALAVALLACLTLVPALMAIAGRSFFWPGTRDRWTLGRRMWPRLAGWVVRRPGWILAVTLAAMLLPAWHGLRQRWVYDTLASLSGKYDSVQGLQTIRRHWPVGEVSPVRILIRADQPADAAIWKARDRALTAAVADLPGVGNVRSLAAPLGTQTGGVSNALAGMIGRDRIAAEYVGRNGRTTRMDAVLTDPPLSLQAMDTVRNIRRALEGAAERAGLKADVMIAGATAEMMDIRTITQTDFHRIAVLSLTVIFGIVVVLLRKPLLTGFMVASTVLSYLSTLGVSAWVFSGLLGGAGLDWKVEVFLFVVMVAVGVDYNIFLAARLAQEARRLPTVQAARQATIQTGPVISSAGLIMAATLGSLMSGDLLLLRQLGFAFALGMLIDTFVVRPLLLPAFAVLTRRDRRPEPPPPPYRNDMA